MRVYFFFVVAVYSCSGDAGIGVDYAINNAALCARYNLHIRRVYIFRFVDVALLQARVAMEARFISILFLYTFGTKFCVSSCL